MIYKNLKDVYNYQIVSDLIYIKIKYFRVLDFLEVVYNLRGLLGFYYFYYVFY